MKHLRHHQSSALHALTLIVFTLLTIRVESVHATEIASTVERVFFEPAAMALDGNIQPRYAIERASWVWHPGLAAGQKAVLQFRNEFSVEQPQEIIFHVSADHRYELSLDGNDKGLAVPQCIHLKCQFPSAQFLRPTQAAQA